MTAPNGQVGTAVPVPVADEIDVSAVPYSHFFTAILMHYLYLSYIRVFLVPIPIALLKVRRPIEIRVHQDAMTAPNGQVGTAVPVPVADEIGVFLVPIPIALLKVRRPIEVCVHQDAMTAPNGQVGTAVPIPVADEIGVFLVPIPITLLKVIRPIEVCVYPDAMIMPYANVCPTISIKVTDQKLVIGPFRQNSSLVRSSNGYQA
jgi:hypothetical protein